MACPAAGRVLLVETQISTWPPRISTQLGGKSVPLWSRRSHCSTGRWSTRSSHLARAGILLLGVLCRRRCRQRVAHTTHSSASPEGAVPLLVLHDLQSKHLWQEERKNHHLRRRFRDLLSWAVPLVPDKLRVLELRLDGAESAVPALMPEVTRSSFNDLVEVIDVKLGLSAVLDVSSPRALVCGGVLELALYPCHDLLRSGVKEIGLSPHLCGTSGRSGELLRARATSHIETVLNVDILGSPQAATKWLLPEGPVMQPPPPNAQHELQIDLVSDDSTQLSEDQMLLVRLLLPLEISQVTLRRIGIGWSSAMKFVCEPTVSQASAEAAGAPTFLKMGKVEKLEHELNVTYYMMEVLGGFCPQVLGYAEHGGLGAILLSLADLGNRNPRGLAELYRELLANGKVGTPAGEELLGRLVGAIDFVFQQLLRRLHSATTSEIHSFSIADELGLCRDLPGGKTGTEHGLNLNSAWVLDKVCRASPGDSLESNVMALVQQIMGDEAAQGDTLWFLPGHILELPNICPAFLGDHELLAKLRETSRHFHRTCFVHGDLHGDNIMIDARDNRFLIDFGKTGIGVSLEDATWLESFLLLSYTPLENDQDLAGALDMVPLLAPETGVTQQSCEEFAKLASRGTGFPRADAARAVVARVRHHLGHGISRVARVAPMELSSALDQASLAATLLLLRNSLFFMVARENRDQPRRRRFALALACAYAQSSLALMRSLDDCSPGIAYKRKKA